MLQRLKRFFRLSSLVNVFRIHILSALEPVLNVQLVSVYHILSRSWALLGEIALDVVNEGKGLSAPIF